MSNNYLVSFDTGSSEIVFPSSLCVSLIEVLQRSKGNRCVYYYEVRTGAGIYCDQGLDGLSLNFLIQGGDGFSLKNEYIIEKSLNKIDVMCSPSHKNP